MLTNTDFDTQPVIIHAQGRQNASPHWAPIRDRFFANHLLPALRDTRLTIITWNNNPTGPGLFEQSLAHMGLAPMVLGRGIANWVNSIHKPSLTLAALETITTDYVLAVDSFDAIAVRAPSHAVDLFDANFSCDLLFNAGKVCWPDLQQFRSFERSLPGAANSAFRYLNGGAWIGRTQFCRDFFAALADTPPLDAWPESEQGRLKQLFPDWYPFVSLDYNCRIFQTLQYVFDPILVFDTPSPEKGNKCLGFP
ncbi:glycosyltransferase domain-containing protein [Roseovarius aestuarii]|uniref:PLOD1-3-like GT domain-containing protein n=1 Tax=Roseovarius aestuarii TaxID=475083 RepID=A0A1X7BTP2_9RHOB|nr:glycosyltransferase domain-containing protein [Roseovarius aestuarii]SMC12870.1 hypothetical protein ROA7745_02702 [Roseovarius aestuarii]